jgi:signal transduction histidine kinase
MDASVIRFKRTVADLTDISKVEKQMDDRWEEMHIARLISEILLDMSISIAESGACIEQHVEACPLIIFPKKNLKSVLYNLISNAIKYRDSTRTPYITISCR